MTRCAQPVLGLLATALWSQRGTRVVARRPVRIGLIRSLVGVKYAKARYSPVMIPGTSWGGIDSGLFSGPYVPLVRWLRRHGLCPCDCQGEQNYSKMPHHSFLFAMADHRQQRWRAAISSIGHHTATAWRDYQCEARTRDALWWAWKPLYCFVPSGRLKP